MQTTTNAAKGSVSNREGKGEGAGVDEDEGKWTAGAEALDEQTVQLPTLVTFR